MLQLVELRKIGLVYSHFGIAQERYTGEGEAEENEIAPNPLLWDSGENCCKYSNVIATKHKTYTWEYVNGVTYLVPICCASRCALGI